MEVGCAGKVEVGCAGEVEVGCAGKVPLYGNCQLCERPSWPNGPTHFEPLRSYTPKVLYPVRFSMERKTIIYQR